MGEQETRLVLEILLMVSEYAVKNDPKLASELKGHIQKWFNVKSTAMPFERQRIVDLAKRFGVDAPDGWAS